VTEIYSSAPFPSCRLKVSPPQVLKEVLEDVRRLRSDQVRKYSGIPGIPDFPIIPLILFVDLFNSFMRIVVTTC
jgi:hypothetical protein